MAVGLHTVNLANAWLNCIVGATNKVTFTALAAIYVKLHTDAGDPGANGTANAAAGSTTRPTATLTAGNAGAVSITGTNPVWTNGGTSETIKYITVWDNSTAGNVYWSAMITTAQAWASGNTFTLTSLGMSLAPLMA